MRKKVERKYYSKDKKSYFLTLSKSMVGIFNIDGDCLGRVLSKEFDMCKCAIDNEIYLFRWFKSKGFILGYKISNNDIDLKNSLVFSLEKLGEFNYVDLWKDIDLN